MKLRHAVRDHERRKALARAQRTREADMRSRAFAEAPVTPGVRGGRADLVEHKAAGQRLAPGVMRQVR